SLFVILFDIGLLMPCFQTVILLGRSVEAAARATGVNAALEEAADDVRLADGPAPIQPATAQGIEPPGPSKDQIMASLDLVEIPLVSEHLAANLGRNQRDAAVDPTIAEGGNGLRREGLASFLEDLRVVDLNEEVIAHLEADASVAELLGDEVMTVEANGDGEGGVATNPEGVAHAELAILDEEVVVVDATATSGNLPRLVLSLFGNIGDEGRGFFLDFDDAVNGLGAVRHTVEVGRRLVNVRFAGFGREDRDVVRLSHVLDELHEVGGDLLKVPGFDPLHAAEAIEERAQQTDVLELHDVTSDTHAVDQGVLQGDGIREAIG